MADIQIWQFLKKRQILSVGLMKQNLYKEQPKIILGIIRNV